MEALQSVKDSLTALASMIKEYASLIKEEIDSTTAMINHVKESVRERMERMDQKLAEEASRIRKERSESFQTSHHQSVEVCRRENNDDEEEEESEFHDAIGSSNYIQEDEHEFPDSKFQNMAKDESAGEDGVQSLELLLSHEAEENKY